ncbi:hypothetical protein IWQ61_006682 [Dispira simplex]|nr:hypothetical protein IWQ61_006682 [Dispira simplex]
MSSKISYPSAARSTNTYTAQCQGLTLKEADGQRANEINLDVARRMILNQSNFIEKVMEESSIGEYSHIAEDFEALGEVVNPYPNSLHQRLYQKASEWFNPIGRSEGGNQEAQIQTRGKPKLAPGMRNKRSSKGKQPKGAPSKPEPEPESEVDVTQSPFWRCFGVVECKADYSKAQEQVEYGQLGWYACFALEVAFEQNTMWGWVISKMTVQFVLFTHGAAVSSKAIDMKEKSSHQIHPTLAYVKPLPLKIHGSLFGRRTHCHRASLTKHAKEYELVLKESWAELDHDLKNRKMMNTEALPNEVCIFREISKSRNEFIGKSILMMKVGGSVYIKVDVAPGSAHSSTVEKYCGKLDIVNIKYKGQPQTSTMTESGTDNDIPDIRVINWVHQQILMSPVGESMAAFYTWAHNPKYIEKFGKMNGSELLVDHVVYVFVRLFWVIYNLHKDCNVYHGNLSKGNVLVREYDGDPYPLLIDFNHGHLCSDVGNDEMRFGMGMVPFMSMLNLAGYSNKLSIVDEL